METTIAIDRPAPVVLPQGRATAHRQAAEKTARIARVDMGAAVGLRQHQQQGEGGGATGRRPRRSSSKAFVEDEAEACANWREAGRMNVAHRHQHPAAPPGGSAGAPSGHQHAGRSSAGKPPALTPAKRNRRVSGGGWSSSRGAGKTLLSSRGLEGEDDEEEGVLSSASCDHASGGGASGQQQQPLKKKRSLPQHPGHHHSQQKGGEGTTSWGLVPMSDGGRGDRGGEEERKTNESPGGEQEERRNPAREHEDDESSSGTSPPMSSEQTEEKENSSSKSYVLFSRGTPGVCTPGGDITNNVASRGKRSSVCTASTSSSGGGGDPGLSFARGGKRNGRRSVGGGGGGGNTRRRRTSGGGGGGGCSGVSTGGASAAAAGASPDPLRQQSPSLLVQHMRAISAPFLHIPGFVSPMFVPMGTTPSGLLFPHPNAKELTHSTDGAKDEEEEWARRESARMKDIAIGKATEGYRNFIRTVPRDQRKEDDPATPNPKQRCTKAEFQREYLAWRKQLHRYDTCPSMAASETLEGESRSCWAAGGGLGSDFGSLVEKQQDGGREEGRSEQQSSSSGSGMGQAGGGGGLGLLLPLGEVAAKAAAARLCGGGGPERGRRSAVTGGGAGGGGGSLDRKDGSEETGEGASDRETDDTILAFNRDCELAGL